MEPTTITKDELRNEVKRRYTEAAETVLAGKGAACCGGSCGADPTSSDIYEAGHTHGLPEDAVKASLGCGNPTALAELQEGQTVLDLGSGGGIDVLLSARRVGPTGFAYGLDMTDAMLDLAERNRTEAGVENVRFLKGVIESIPLPDASVDVILSNCVVNLSTDKDAVFREAFRGLRPGGKWAVADVVALQTLPEQLQRNLEAYAGCIAGALVVDDYRQRLEAAGFQDVEAQILRRYGVGELGGGCCSYRTGSNPENEAQLASAFIRARKPAIPTRTAGQSSL